MSCDKLIATIKKVILNDSNIGQFYLKSHPRTKYNLELILKEIIFVLRTGISWRDLRSSINWQSVYWHFKRFSKHNIFQKSFISLRNKYIKNNSSNIFAIDTTFITNKKGFNKLGRNIMNKNKKSSKISLIVDTNGTPLSISIDRGNKHDLRFCNSHLKDLNTKLNNKILLGDRGYVSQQLRTQLESKFNTKLMVMKKKNMINGGYFDKNIYKKRIVVENTFQKIKSFKRIQLRYDYYHSTYKSFVLLASSIILNRNL